MATVCKRGESLLLPLNALSAPRQSYCISTHQTRRSEAIRFMKRKLAEIREGISLDELLKTLSTQFEKLPAEQRDAKRREIARLSSLPPHGHFEMLNEPIVGLPDRNHDSERQELAALILQGVDAKLDNRTEERPSWQNN